MPITADLGGKSYTLGRGRAFFDRYPANTPISAALAGEGERYIGNTPEFTTSSESEDLEHFDSDQGIRVKDDAVQLSMDRNGSFMTDNIDRENIALYFLGTSGSVTQTALSAQTTTVTIKRGNFYQMGASPSLPTGLRNIKNVTAEKDPSGTPAAVTAAGNFEIDEVLGRIYILPNAANLADDDEVEFTFDTDASTRAQVVSSSQSIYGALRFVADNPKGVNRDYYFPYVKLAPDGDYNLKGDDWQQMGFTFEILKKASNVEAVYVDDRPVVTP